MAVVRRRLGVRSRGTDGGTVFDAWLLETYGACLSKAFGDRAQCVLACLRLSLTWSVRSGSARIGTFFIIPTNENRQDLFQKHINETQLEDPLTPNSLSVFNHEHEQALTKCALSDGGFFVDSNGDVVCANHSCNANMTPPDESNLPRCHGGSAHRLCQVLSWYWTGVAAIKLSKKTGRTTVFAEGKDICLLPPGVGGSTKDDLRTDAVRRPSSREQLRSLALDLVTGVIGGRDYTVVRAGRQLQVIVQAQVFSVDEPLKYKVKVIDTQSGESETVRRVREEEAQEEAILHLLRKLQ